MGLGLLICASILREDGQITDVLLGDRPAQLQMMPAEQPELREHLGNQDAW